MSTTPLISIKDGTQQILVEIDDIIWIEAHEQYSYIKLNGEANKNKKYITKSSLKKLQTKLCPLYPSLVRVSKFYIVNLKAISAIDKIKTTGTSNIKEHIKFRNDSKLVAIGRGYKKELKALFFEI